MEPHHLKVKLLAYGKEIGLDLIGVAGAEPFLTEERHLVRQQEAGLGPGPFEYPEIPPRVHPHLNLPEVRSIIAGGISYLIDPAAPGGEPKTATGPRGWLSRYCRGLDYHPILRQRLEQVASWLKEQVPGAQTLVHVDTSPTLDRAVAARAGIGKFGKHTNLITRKYGTWVFLGEILTDVYLPPDEPATAACGSCTLCLDACPTGCLTPWSLDPWRCLSTITQMKGLIPPEYREVMGNRLFGCDDCQDVCPYNRKAQSGGHLEFAPVPELGPEPDLLQIMSMTKGDFNHLLKPTAAGWRGKTTIQRNALVALGNSGDPAALEPLVQALSSQSAVLRAHAAWALGRLGRLHKESAAAAYQALQDHRRDETESTVQLEIAAALESLGDR